jgi:hypothetical protein
LMKTNRQTIQTRGTRSLEWRAANSSQTPGAPVSELFKANLYAPLAPVISTGFGRSNSSDPRCPSARTAGR